MEEKSKPSTAKSPPKMPDRIYGMELSFQNLKTVSSNILLLTAIKELFLNNNELTAIPKDIYKLRNLEKLHLGFNKIKYVCPNLGKAVSLKELLLNDNLITNLPMELGTLYKLEKINLNNNPLVSPFNILSKDKLIIHFCRENNTSYKAPTDRAWIDCIYNFESKVPAQPNKNIVSVGSYNILCNYYAGKCTYAPSWVINPDLRRENIIQNIVSYNVDILALQEIEITSYSEYYEEVLSSRLNYASIFFPRRGSSFPSEKRIHDGCATFWRRDKYNLVESKLLDYTKSILDDPRFSSNQDVTSRHSKRDNIAVFTVLENQDKTKIIVVNTHLYWNPDFADIKLLQAILMIEEVIEFKSKYPESPVIILGDFNSLRNSHVYSLLANSSTGPNCFDLFDYSPFNKGFKHGLSLQDAYGTQDLTFTNFTPTFRETIDYIFFTNNFTLKSVLSPLEDEYAETCVGLPNIHFPSDHLFIGAKIELENQERKIDK